MQRLHSQIDKAGGLATLAGLARRYGLSAQRMSQLAHSETFPAPLRLVGGGDVYSVAEVDAWRERRAETRERGNLSTEGKGKQR